MSSDEQPKSNFLVIWDYTGESTSWHTRAGLVLDMVGSLALFSEDVEESSGVAEEVMEALGDLDGSFLAAWKKRFRADPVQATALWQKEIEPELIRRWMEQTAAAEN